MIKRFANTHEFCNEDIKKLILLLRKGVDPYEYMDSWERFDEKLLANKKYFYSNRNMEGISDPDYRRRKRVFRDFNNTIIQSDKLLQVEVSQNFRNKCIEIF